MRFLIKNGRGKNLLLNRLTLGVEHVLKNGLLVLVSVVVLNLTSCQNLDDIKDRLDNVEASVGDLQSAQKVLQDAYNQAKIIQAVDAVDDVPAGGQIITFTDGSKIKFVNGIVEDITEDKETGVVTIKLNGGRSVWFNTKSVFPTGIVILSEKTIELQYGSQEILEFRVNPSNATFVMTGDNAQIVLDAVSTTRSSYVTATDKFCLANVEQVTDEDGNVKVGQYRAIIEDTKKYAEYDVTTALVLNVDDAAGNKVQVSSSVFNVKNNYPIHLVDNGLPVLLVNTPDAAPILSKEEYVTGSEVTLINTDLTYGVSAAMKIKGRGNSTWDQPKKPYKMKLDEKVSYFGDTKDKEWVLLANYIDKSMLKTAFTYKMAGDYGHFDFVPKFSFVDLILNGSYNGTYQLGDQMKISKGRALNGEDGYLLETDYRANFESDAVIFKSKKIAYPFNIKDMKVNGVEDVTASEDDPNYVYIRDFVLNAKNVLYSDKWLDSENGYKKYLDMQSYVEWYLINEIGRNNDACFFSSCYMTLKIGDGEKLHMGPLWDFDLAYGGTTNGGNDQPKGFYIKNCGWWVRLFQDPEFVNAVKTQYNIYYAHKEDLLNSIDQYAAAIEKSAIANNTKWGTLCNKASDEQTTRQAFYTQVDNLKTWITTRMDWMKQEFDAM